MPIQVNPALCGFVPALLHSPFRRVGGRPSGFDLADTEQIRPLAGMHRRDHRGKVVDLAITQLWRPAGNIVFDQSPGDLPDPPVAKINIAPRSGGDHCAVTDDCVGRWPDDRCRRGSAPPRATNLCVRAGYVTESGDALQPPYEKHQTVHAVNARPGRAAQIA